MKKAVNRLAVIFAAMVVAIGLFGTVSAQKSEKQVRDLVRSLSSQVDNFQYTVEDDMRRNSANEQDIDALSVSLSNLQIKISEFEDNVSQRRENRDDVNAMITAAQNIE